MGSVSFYCEREVHMDGTLWIKNKVYHDPKKKLQPGKKVIVENPHHPKFAAQGRLYVYDLHMFLLTSVELFSLSRVEPVKDGLG